MAERIKLNKVSLREQKNKRAMYLRFLPALEARKQQFLLRLAKARQEIQRQEAAFRDLLADMAAWSSLYRDILDVLGYFAEIREVRFVTRNVAGLQVPEFQDVVFAEPSYSLFAAPYSFEVLVDKAREAIRRREELALLREQERILFEGFRKTSQRINLYEQRLIPECREAIRKITVYLQDQQAASVGVAKVAKRMAEELASSA